MVKVLGAQILELDTRERYISDEEIEKVDLTNVSTSNLFLHEAPPIKQALLQELIRLFWAHKDQLDSQFPHCELQDSLTHEEDPWATLLFLLEEFITAYVHWLEREVKREGSLAVPIAISDFVMREEAALTGEERASTFEHLRTEIITGSVLWAQFIELVGRVYRKQFNDVIPATVYAEIIRSPLFINIVVSLGMSSSVAELAFIETVRKKDHDLDRFCFNEDCFELLDRGGKLVLIMKSEVAQKMKEAFVNEHQQKGLRGVCPATQVKGEKTVVLKEFAQWVGELFCQYYVPLVSKNQ